MIKINITDGTKESFSIENWQKDYLKPISVLTKKDLNFYDEAVKEISTASLSKVLRDNNINVFIWDKGFVCFNINKDKECFVKAYYESKKAKYNKGQRKAFYEFLKQNNIKQIRARTIVPKKTFENWGFKAVNKLKGININRLDSKRIEIVKEL